MAPHPRIEEIFRIGMETTPGTCVLPSGQEEPAKRPKGMCQRCGAPLGRIEKRELTGILCWDCDPRLLRHM